VPVHQRSTTASVNSAQRSRRKWNSRGPRAFSMWVMGFGLMYYTLSILGLVNIVGASLSYFIHAGTIATQFHAAMEALLR
jgi:hypothetical protein